MPRTLRYNLVDVFTDIPLTGNQLAVFTNGRGLSDAAMQNIAREMKLSETVFFFPAEQGGHARLRIFTPAQELPFAGHPVLGAAWVLGQPMELSPLKIETRGGIIEVALEREGGQLHLGRMRQPLPTLTPYQGEAELHAALGSRAGDRRLPTVLADNGPCHLLVEMGSKEELDALSPDFAALERVSHAGVLCFCQTEQGCFARYFFPGGGIPEDPATGSAVGPLAAHLVRHQRLSSGEQLAVFQGEAMKRPSRLLATAFMEGDVLTSVEVAGSAVVVGRGDLLL